MMYLGNDAVALTTVSSAVANKFPISLAYGFRYLFQNAVFPSTSVVIDFEGATINRLATPPIGDDNACINMFNGCNLVNLTIKNLNVLGSSVENMFRNCASLKTITFDNCNIAPLNMNNFFNTVPNLEAVYGTIDFTNASYVSNFTVSSTKITHMRFKPDSLKVTFNMQYSPIDDDTIVSLANCLDGTVTGQILYINNSTAKARCSTLMGNNINGVFVKDENGTMNVKEFVSTVKGWSSNL